METGVQRWSLKPNTDRDDSSARLAGVAARDRGGPETVWLERNGSGEELLRDRTRRLLVAPRTAAARHRERGSGRGVDRSRPATEAGQDGPDGRGEIGAAIDATLARRTRLEQGARAGYGGRRCATTASGYGRPEARERSLSIADSVLIVHAGHRYARRQELFRKARAA